MRIADMRAGKPRFQATMGSGSLSALEANAERSVVNLRESASESALNNWACPLATDRPRNA